MSMPNIEEGLFGLFRMDKKFDWQLSCRQPKKHRKGIPMDRPQYSLWGCSHTQFVSIFLVLLSGFFLQRPLQASPPVHMPAPISDQTPSQNSAESSFVGEGNLLHPSSLQVGNSQIGTSQVSNSQSILPAERLAHWVKKRYRKDLQKTQEFLGTLSQRARMDSEIAKDWFASERPNSPKKLTALSSLSALSLVVWLGLIQQPVLADSMGDSVYVPMTLSEIYQSPIRMNDYLEQGNLDAALLFIRSKHVLFGKEHLNAEEQERMDAFNTYLDDFREELETREFTPAEWNDRLTKLVATFQDPHFTTSSFIHLVNSGEAMYRPQPFNDTNRAALGINIEFWNSNPSKEEHFFIKNINKSLNPDLDSGVKYYELTRINGLSVREYLEQEVYPYIATPNESLKFKTALLYLTERPLNRFPVVSPEPVTMEFVSSRTDTKIIHSFNWHLINDDQLDPSQLELKKARAEAQERIAKDFPPSWKGDHLSFNGLPFVLFQNGDKVAAVYHLQDFMGSDQHCIAGDCSQISTSDYIHAFEALSKPPVGVKQVFLDLRQNHGGSVTAAGYLAKALIAGLFHTPTMQAAFSPELIGTFKFMENYASSHHLDPLPWQEIRKAAEELAAHQLQGEPGTVQMPLDLSIEQSGQGDEVSSLEFIVLMGPESGSAAEILPGLLKQFGIKVVGQPSAGALGTLDPSSFKTPTTSLTIHISNSGSLNGETQITPTEGYQTESIQGPDFWQEVEQLTGYAD